MRNSALIARGPLDSCVRPGRFGAESEKPGITVQLLENFGFATVISHSNKETELAEAVRKHYGIHAPRTARWVRGPVVSLVGSGPGHWVAHSTRLLDGALASELKDRLGEFASIIDQSDGRVLLRICGPGVRDVLAKGVPVDLHPRAFGTGNAASTSIGHISIQLWQVDDSPTYELAVFRSLAASLWRWLMSASAQVGCEVIVPERPEWPRNP